MCNSLQDKRGYGYSHSRTLPAAGKAVEAHPRRDSGRKIEKGRMADCRVAKVLRREAPGRAVSTQLTRVDTIDPTTAVELAIASGTRLTGLDDQFGF